MSRYSFNSLLGVLFTIVGNKCKTLQNTIKRVKILIQWKRYSTLQRVVALSLAKKILWTFPTPLNNSFKSESVVSSDKFVTRTVKSSGWKLIVTYLTHEIPSDYCTSTIQINSGSSSRSYSSAAKRRRNVSSRFHFFFRFLLSSAITWNFTKRL